MIALYSCHAERRESKLLKLCPHRVFPQAEWWLWIDWNVRLMVSPETLVDIASADVMGFAHKLHDCAYEEHAACARMQKDDPDVMRRQMDRYRLAKFPEHFGLLECGLLLRKNTRQVIEFNELWYGEVCRGSLRDQLSVGYAAWRTGIRWGCFPGSVWDNAYCEVAA